MSLYISLCQTFTTVNARLPEANTCVCCHFPKGKRDCSASYVLQTRCCLGALDSVTSVAVLYSPPGPWRLVFNLTVFVFITFTFSCASYSEKQSENLPWLLRSPLWSIDYRLRPPRLLLVITPVVAVSSLILWHTHMTACYFCVALYQTENSVPRSLSVTIAVFAILPCRSVVLLWGFV